MSKPFKPQPLEITRQEMKHDDSLKKAERTVTRNASFFNILHVYDLNNIWTDSLRKQYVEFLCDVFD